MCWRATFPGVVPGKTTDGPGRENRHGGGAAGTFTTEKNVTGRLRSVLTLS